MTDSFNHWATEAAALSCTVGGHFRGDPHFIEFSPALPYLLQSPRPASLQHMSKGFAESEPEIGNNADEASLASKKLFVEGSPQEHRSAPGALAWG